MMRIKGLLLIAILCYPISVFAAEGEQPDYLLQHWSFDGMFGLFDRGQLRRGYQVYKEVCSTCHAMNYMRFRNLGEKGGLEYSGEQVKAIAAEFEIRAGPNREGDMFQRKRVPSDPFPKPFANDKLARAANGGALPPDLSLITKARFGGADFVYSLLQGYSAPPIGMKLLPGQYYNRYMSHPIAMAPPLSDGQLVYRDGTKATVAQMSADVAAFLTWSADPHMEKRKRIGFQVLIYLSLLTVLLFLTNRRVWKNKPPSDV